MRQFLASAVLAAAVVFGSAGVADPARAATAFDRPAGAGAQVELVSGGCGPYAFRDRFGRCVRRGYVPPSRLRCPPFAHPTPYGCRRNY